MATATPADSLDFESVEAPDLVGLVEAQLTRAIVEGRLAPGDIVTARQRPYGVEFASGATQQAFFLVLNDDWYRELQTNAVVL